jgi:hypothetical protein
LVIGDGGGRLAGCNKNGAEGLGQHRHPFYLFFPKRSAPSKADTTRRRWEESSGLQREKQPNSEGARLLYWFGRAPTSPKTAPVPVRVKEQLLLGS